MEINVQSSHNVLEEKSGPIITATRDWVKENPQNRRCSIEYYVADYGRLGPQEVVLIWAEDFGENEGTYVTTVQDLVNINDLIGVKS